MVVVEMMDLTLRKYFIGPTMLGMSMTEDNENENEPKREGCGRSLASSCKKKQCIIETSVIIAF